MGTIFRALKKSHHRFQITHNPADDRYDKKKSAVDNKNENYNLVPETGLKPFLNEAGSSRILEKIIFPEEYQKKTLEKRQAGDATKI